MFNLPQEYQTEVILKLKEFIPKDLKPAVRKKLSDILKEVKLVGQIAGENIPSVVNENYNCQVIQFYELNVSDIRKAAFVATTYQNLIKSPCVLRIYDGLKEIYSLGLKRLNQLEKDAVVLTDSQVTQTFPVMLPDLEKDEFLKQLAYPNICNKNNKVDYYLEMYLRTYILNHHKADEQMIALLTSNLWYDLEKSMKAFEVIKTLVENKEKINKLTSNGEKIKMNQTIRNNLNELKTIINGG
ncbi:MAG: DUF4391 domain-containing protein [Eubacteriaceae bacterium]|jgi:hypothetical protein